MARKSIQKKLILFLILLMFAAVVSASQKLSILIPSSLNMESLLFILFGMVLVGIAFNHKNAFYFSVFGALTILLFKEWINPDFNLLHHIFGDNSIAEQLLSKEARQGEWPILINLFGLLLGFAILAKYFEDSGVPDLIPRYLPSGWLGPFVLLVFIFVMSTFLDNIAAALVGGTLALVVFRRNVHIGYIAAIVAASNAGGAGSVVGDTTTTMMWIDGVNAFDVLHAFIASIIALLIFGWFASHQQQKLYPLVKADGKTKYRIKWVNMLAVITILIGAILSNIFYDMPALGVWIAILISAFYAKVPWSELKHNMRGTIFLLGLIFSASMMPVNELPTASWSTAFVLGIVSAFFDNIPLTKICLDQGHYDWGLLAYAVGFGGSMMWFGSSAGVAITNRFHQARDVKLWLKNGWHVIIAYVVGFFFLLFVLGWRPADNKKHKVENCPVIDCPFKNSMEK